MINKSYRQKRQWNSKLKRHQDKMLSVDYSANHDMFIFKHIKHDTISNHVCGDQNMYFCFFIIFSKPSGLPLSLFCCVLAICK